MTIRAFLILTGQELLRDKVDTNSLMMARLLEAWGIEAVGKMIVGDEVGVISAAFTYAAGQADLVMSSGGLGPTFDDLTRDGLAAALNLKLVLDPGAVEQIRGYFHRRGAVMPDINLQQACLPSGGKMLPNANGTAPGILLENAGKLFVLLPGPPGELKPMLESVLAQEIREFWGLRPDKAVRGLQVHACGLGESVAAERLGTILTDPPEGVRMGILAHAGGITVKAESRLADASKTAGQLAAIQQQIRQVIGEHVYGEGGDTLLSVCHALLLKKGLSLAVAESCTGGLLSQMLTSLPGSSAYYWGGLCTYDNRAKQMVLNVPLSRLETYGAVSAEVAGDMAQGLRQLSAADIVLSITGIAGPEGGSEEKPVGLVYIGIMDAGSMQVEQFLMTGDREMVRQRTAITALTMLWRKIKGEEYGK
jgi:nicotinamide-nucleotide amidase